MNMQRLLACSFLVVLSACSAECSCGGSGDDDDSTSSGTGGSGNTTATGPTTTATATGSGGSDGTGGGGTGGDGTGGGGDSGGVSLRLAHLSPDSAGYNFCLVDAETDEVIGPIVDGGLAFKDITEYGAYHSGAYSIVLVAGGADGCGTPLAESEPVQMNFGDVHTLAVIGRADADPEDEEALGFVIYDDDLSAPAEGNVRARFIHAAPGAPDVDIGYYDENEEFVALWTGTSYPNDAGYVELEAFEELELVARAGGADLLTVDVSGPAGMIVEGIAVGLESGAGAEVVTVTSEPPPPAE